jgi:NADH-quinone oxidoreductase subunit L
MTHAFFKALLFLGSGSVIHAMAGEQDMRRMGGLKKYLPVTYMTMLIGTLAIAGIPPLAGFFSKDEILFRAFLGNKAIWVIAVATALMTAFYMFRLVSMTFFGPYRGPAWEAAGHLAADGHAPGDDRKVAHGRAEPHEDARAADAAHGGGGQGAGSWHGPHESPTLMTLPLMALAVGAIVAGFVGIPAALGGGNAIEQFLEPSFTASPVVQGSNPAEGAARVARGSSPAEGAARVAQGLSPAGEASLVAQDFSPAGAAEVSRATELGLMTLSVLIAIVGIALAHKFYVTKPEISNNLAERWASAHRTLSNKYYVDELYNATVVSGTFASARGLWTFDRRVVDGAVNGTSWMTIVSSWFSGLTDRTVVDGLVNLVGRVCQEGSFWFRRFQSGLVQNYALLMLFGIFAFVSIYLFMR